MRIKIVRNASTKGRPQASTPLATLAYEQFHSGLYRYLLRRLGSAQNAEDLAQEVYLRLLRTADPGQVKYPQAYVYRVAFNVLYEFRLRARGDPVVFDSETVAEAADELPDDATLPEQAYEDGAKERQFERAIAQLPPMQRAVLRLATHHNLAHAQIAEKLGISVSTVRNHLYKAVDFCRHEVGRQRHSDDPG
jgi:RNA polymerase sigma factor (sigma-70 family)